MTVSNPSCNRCRRDPDTCKRCVSCKKHCTCNVTNETHIEMACGCGVKRLFRHEDIEDAHEWLDNHEHLPVRDEDSEQGRLLDMADNFPEWYGRGPP